MLVKTLIELYDERPLENILGTEMFSPERTVYICPAQIAENLHIRKSLAVFFRARRVRTKLIFIEADMYDPADVLSKLKIISDKYEDCAIDITGGTDAALFACGLFCCGSSVPVFTYSRKMNTFYSISNAAFANGLVCDIRYSVKDFFLMAGGIVRMGRVDNRKLKKYLDIIDPFFAIFLRYRRQWQDIVTYMQRVSPTAPKGEKTGLHVEAAYTVKGERSAKVNANEDALHDLADIGLIRDLNIDSREHVSFTFRDSQIRAWLRDVGSVLELYTYKACLETGVFNDVQTSTVVDWGTDSQGSTVSNELDVMASHGIMPVFISCKTADVKTEALNELAVLRDRFGGHGARAAIVTAESGRVPMRHRASELDIDVIDISDLRSGMFKERLRALAKARSVNSGYVQHSER